MLRSIQEMSLKIARGVFAIAAIALIVAAIPAFAQSPEFSNYNSGYSVRNLGTSEATVTIQYYNESTGALETTVTVPDPIPVNGEVTFFEIGELDAGFSGSAVVSSNQPLASVVILEATSPSDVDTTATYTALTEAATSVFIPQLFKDHFSILDTWYAVQNTGADDATVNVSYSDGASAGPVIIKSGASAFFYQSDETHSASIFAATITSDEPIVATAVQENSGQSQLRAYNGTSTASTELFMPLAMMNHWGFKTVIMIQNTGTLATDVTMQYTPNAVAPTYGTQCTETISLDPGESKPFMVKVLKEGSSPLSGTVEDCTQGERFLGSAQVIANSASQPLVAMVEVANDTSGSDLYNPFTVSGATSNVAFPLVMDANAGFRSVLRIFNVGGTETEVTCTFANAAYEYVATLDAGESFVDPQTNDLSTGSGYVGSAVCTADNGGLIIGTGELGIPGSRIDSLRFYDGVNY